MLVDCQMCSSSSSPYIEDIPAGMETQSLLSVFQVGSYQFHGSYFKRKKVSGPRFRNSTRRDFRVMMRDKRKSIYSQTKWSVPLMIALTNWLFKTWTRWSFQDYSNIELASSIQEYG